jgi:hypothetical protein
VQVKYIDAWTTVLHDAIAVRQLTHENNSAYTSCRTWTAERALIAQHFGHSLRALRRLDAIFSVAPAHGKMPDCCEYGKLLWRVEIEDAIAQIPPFTSFM